MLSASDASEDVELRNIVDSTSAVIFMGTPHRGSPNMASLGEMCRRIASAVRMDTASTALDTLALKTSDLERCEISFSRIWNKRYFRVKTFEEAFGLVRANIGTLNEKVVPQSSSRLGDFREEAESLQANHMDMCRFCGTDDPNYGKVGGELVKIYMSLVASLGSWEDERTGHPTTQRVVTKRTNLDHLETGVPPLLLLIP